MKHLKTRLAVGISICGLYFVSQEYMINHTYYDGMLGSSDNRMLFVMAIIAALIPVGYTLYSKKISLISYAVWSFLGLAVFGISYVGIKDNFIGVAGQFKLVMMLAIFTAMIGIFYSSITVLGAKVYEYLWHPVQKIHDVIISLGIGLMIFIVVNLVLLLTTLFYPIVSWLLAAGLIALLYFEGDIRTRIASILSTLISEDNNSFGIKHVLLVLTFAYFFFSVLHGYIPYSTAWDANHLYMYIPKIWAQNHGYLWGSQFSAPAAQGRLVFVSYRFSLFNNFNLLRVSPDSVAVLMNVTSAWLSLFFTLALVSKGYEFIATRMEMERFSQHKRPIYIGWFVMLLWMTSGMGAFLVFVDNKSDFGILTFSIMGLYLGLNALQSLHQGQHKIATRDFIASGLAYGIAILSKPTALFDAANFIFFSLGTRFGPLVIVGLVIVALGFISLMKIQSVVYYLPQMWGSMITGLGVGITLFSVVYKRTIQQIYKLKYIVFWFISLALILVIFKLPTVIFSIYLSPGEPGVSDYLRGILLSQTTTNNNSVRPNLYASTTLPTDSCSLKTEGLSTDADLYKTLKPAPSGNEDLGRYIGYGQKEFTNPWWGFIFPSEGCIAWMPDASKLCNDLKLAEINSKDDLPVLQKILSPGSKAEEAVVGAQNRINQGLNPQIVLSDTSRSLDLYRKDNSIMVTKTNDQKIIAIPYKYLVPFNITNNRSLQNLSSYYTDIGIVWLLIMGVLVLATISSYKRKHNELLSLLLTTLGGWIIWILIGSAILWYGIGMIIRSILSLTLWWSRGLKERDSQADIDWKLIALSLIVVAGVFQIILNFIRISSQGGSGPFVWYKFGNGIEQEVGNDLVAKQVPDSWYTADQVFNLQFPHYNKFLRLIDNDTSKSAIMVGGTYLPYFIKPQNRLFQDGFLSNLQEWLSDGNSCRGYLRLKDKGYKYIVIDPNIATVVMGDGNKSLMDRFFGQLNDSGTKILSYGAVTMISKMVNDGYMKGLYSNNIGAQYAFNLSNDEFKEAFGTTSDEEMAITRSKIALARFFPEGNALLTKVATLLSKRMIEGKGVEDLSNLLGKDIETQPLTTSIQEYIRTKNTAGIAQLVPTLNNDQRIVLSNYLSILGVAQSNPEEYNKIIMNLMQQSIGSSSQLIVFEVK